MFFCCRLSAGGKWRWQLDAFADQSFYRLTLRPRSSSEQTSDIRVISFLLGPGKGRGSLLDANFRILKWGSTRTTLRSARTGCLAWPASGFDGQRYPCPVRIREDPLDHQLLYRCWCRSRVASTPVSTKTPSMQEPCLRLIFVPRKIPWNLCFRHKRNFRDRNLVTLWLDIS